MKSLNGPIDIQDARHVSSLSENEQTVEMHIAMCKPKDGAVVALHPWLLCRDFLNEVVLANKSKKEYYVHGFRIGPDFSLDRYTTRYLIKFKHVRDEECFKANQEHCFGVFNAFFNNVKPTKVQCINEDKHIWLVTADKHWQKMPHLLSYHTQFIRLIANERPPQGTSLLELWLNWRKSDHLSTKKYSWGAPMLNVDIQRLRELPEQVLTRGHELIKYLLSHLKNHPKTLTMPNVVEDEDDEYLDDDDNIIEPKRPDNSVDVYDYHDDAGWASLFRRVQNVSVEAYREAFPKWKVF